MIAPRAAAAAALGLVALGSATVARAAEDVCLTPGELDATFAYALPTVIESAAQACRPVLPRDGFLATDGAGLAARYRVGQAAAWPVAKAAALKIGLGAASGHRGGGGGGLGKFAALLPDSALQGFASGFVGQFVVETIRPIDCPEIEQALRLMAPLPPENTAGLITLVVRRIERPRPGQKPRLPLCPISPVPSEASPGTSPSAAH